MRKILKKIIICLALILIIAGGGYYYKVAKADIYLSGSGNTGTLTNSPSTVVGKFGQGLSLNGSNQYVTSGMSGINFQDNTAYSISVWAITTGGGELVCTWAYQSVAGIYFKVTTGGVEWLEATPDGGLARIVTATATDGADGKWHHYVLTYDGSSSGIGAKFYVDGQSKSTTIVRDQSTGALTNTTLYIGQRAGTSPSFFSGSVDDVRIYNRVLSASEAQQLYYQGFKSYSAAF